MSARPVPEPIAPGQESVWDYPRPPAIRASDEEIIVILGGVEICETRTSWRILETVTRRPTTCRARPSSRARCDRRGVIVLRVEGAGRVPGCDRR